MCGVFGFVERRGAPDPALLDRGTDLVAHRGPDGRGTCIDGPVALGHRRLAIIDTSAAGAQPMHDPEAGLSIVYNGEVYNHVELRAELAAAGHLFRTRTDTEVILAAYRRWGSRCVERFNGMWAFALLDRRAQQLWLSRDRFGVKPLLWLDTPERLAFASELRQLLPLLPQRVARREAVVDYLVSGLSDHEEQGFVDGVQQLAPGCNLQVDLRDTRWRIERHYTPQPAAEAPRTPLEAAERAGALLADAVRLRLRSDVRVGTCLSGGLDSSSVAALASGLQPAGAERFRSITAVSEQADNSEEPFARAVVDSSGLEGHFVRPGADDFEAALAEVIDTQETPFGGPSVAMQHFVMREARAQGVVVLLDGQGADEAWMGYERHRAAWLRERERHGAATLWRALRAALRQHEDLSAPRLLALLAGAHLPAVVGRAMAARYPGARFGARLPGAWDRYVRSLGEPLAVQRADLLVTSLPMLLRYADRSSMAQSIEVRLPFLDYRLVELALATPVDVKFHDGWSKWPLRGALDGRLPRSVTWRRRKLGFEAPDRLWLDRLAPRMRDAVAASPLIESLFDRRRLMAGFDGLPRALRWRLFSLAAWERQGGIGSLR